MSRDTFILSHDIPFISRQRLQYTITIDESQVLVAQKQAVGVTKTRMNNPNAENW